jgi:hypothetical protein
MPLGEARNSFVIRSLVRGNSHRGIEYWPEYALLVLDQNDSGEFEENFKFAVPRLMAWAPREYSPEARSFSEDQVFDFGRSFVEQGGRFEVGPCGQGGMFKGDCLADQKRQYVFKITADNYISAGLFTVEVYVERREPTSDWPYLTRMRVEVKP